MTSQERRALGRELQERMQPGMSDRLDRRFNGPARDFGAYTTELLFGEFWQREGLDIRSKEIAVLGALIGGGHLNDLRVHVPIAVNLGLTKHEIIAVALQLALYVGWPRTGEVLGIIEDAFPHDREQPD
jgi:4-carboxymuconolactone decarboxylase